MSNVLKVKIAGQRIKYQVSKVIFAESDLQKAKGWNWNYNGNTLYFNDNKLDILRDYDTFDCSGCGQLTASGIHHYIGPTKAAVNLVFLF